MIRTPAELVYRALGWQRNVLEGLQFFRTLDFVVDLVIDLS